MSLGVVDFSKMDTRITIQVPVESDSVSGEAQKPSWEEFKTCQSERRRRSGSEVNLNNQTAGRNPIDYVIRHDTTRPITFKMRIYEGAFVEGSMTYGYITDVQNYPREGYTFLSVTRWDNG